MPLSSVEHPRFGKPISVFVTRESYRIVQASGRIWVDTVQLAVDNARAWRQREESKVELWARAVVAPFQDRLSKNGDRDGCRSRNEHGEQTMHLL
jgi:hypothetical protein